MNLLFALAVAALAAEERAWPPAAPRLPLAQSIGARHHAPAPTPDLIAAGSRWSNGVQAARILPAAADETFRIVVIGDAEPGRFAWERVFRPGKDVFARQMAAAQRLAPRVVVQLGDFVSEGTVDQYRAHVRYLDENVSAPYLTVAGNHDRSHPNGVGDKALYRAVFGSGDSVADVGGWRLVLLDTADRRMTAAQLAWLDRTLEGAERSLVFMHVPPAFLRGKLKADGFQAKGWRDDPDGYHPFMAFFAQGSAEFGEIARRRRVSRVYVAHIHAFGWARHEGVPYVLTGGGGSPLYPLPPGYPKHKFAHFLDVELSPTGVRETVQTLDGQRIPFSP
ncbi:MAG: metallophosphoesterase [Elusimicrobia bacterium]|nr:metallophosphoesterase [Elusimicrobiota bacterium]